MVWNGGPATAQNLVLHLYCPDPSQFPHLEPITISRPAAATFEVSSRNPPGYYQVVVKNLTPGDGLWGKNLADHLGAVYSNSRYVVIFVSKYYADKVWPNHERQHAQARALRNQDDTILPARFDDTEIPGLPSTINYINLRKTTPDELAEK